MKKAFLLFLMLLAFAFAANSQTTANSGTKSEATADKPKRPPVFRANKDQIAAAQEKLKSDGLYSGDATGKLDDPTREALKKYQAANGLRATGTLNRATLEKMGIELTDKQREIPIPESSYAAEKNSNLANGEKPKRQAVFRATKDQILAAQQLLKSQNLLSGEATGKLDDATRAALRKYQESNGLKVTGTLNRLTLEKMGIELTEKQKQMP
jgi:peptidoglycan hydrolase-like protein with peptidoglycan-binding domain